MAPPPRPRRILPDAPPCAASLRSEPLICFPPAPSLAPPLTDRRLRRVPLIARAARRRASLTAGPSSALVAVCVAHFSFLRAVARFHRAACRLRPCRGTATGGPRRVGPVASCAVCWLCCIRSVTFALYPAGDAALWLSRCTRRPPRLINSLSHPNTNHKSTKHPQTRSGRSNGTLGLNTYDSHGPCRRDNLRGRYKGRKRKQRCRVARTTVD